MKERWIGIGLGAGAMLALGIAWIAPAKAFSLGSTVTAKNFLRDPVTGKRIPYIPAPGEPVIDQGPKKVVVGPAQELTSFGGIWDINLGNSSITFNLNSPIFTNVTSGVDVYRFRAPAFSKSGQYSLLNAKIATFDTSSEVSFTNNNPYVIVREGRRLDVVFPLGFATGDFTKATGTFGVQINLNVRPTPIPTPALLPGLVGMGLAVLRQRRKDGPAE